MDVTESIQTETALKELHSELEMKSWTDSLTGVKNRGYIMTRLEEEIKRSNRYNTALSIIMLDIDYFKNINDTYGHTGGDFILRESAQVICSGTREVDLVGRYGGEEFLILLPDTESSILVTERLRTMIAKHCFNYGEHQIKITISLGGAHYRKNETSLSLLNRADARLYMAKRGGRNRAISSSKLSASC